MNFTQEQINWYNQVTSTGQMTPEQAMAALQAAMQPQVQPVQQPVEQAMQPVQGMASQQAMGAVAQPNATNNILAAFQAIGGVVDEDQGAIVSGKPPRAGVAWVRIKGYVEIGVHQGKNTTFAPKPIALVIFELNHPDHMKTFDGVTEPTEMTVRISKTHSQNSKFPKFFKALSRALGPHPVTGQPITHLSQAIGMGCLAEVYHNKSDDKVYANLDLEGAWSFKPSKYQDPASGVWQQVAIPELQGAPLLFLMDNVDVNKNPDMVKTMWDSIYIDGVRTSKDAAGNDKVTSLNYFQELIAKGLNWTTSETKRILDSLGCKTTFGETNEAQPSNGAMGAPAVPAMAQQPAQPAQVPTYQANVPEQAVPQQEAYVPQQAAPVAQPAMAQAPVQPQVQQPVYTPPSYEQHAPQSVQQPVQQVPQVAQPSVGAPQGAPMSAADFMNQFTA